MMWWWCERAQGRAVALNTGAKAGERGRRFLQKAGKNFQARDLEGGFIGLLRVRSQNAIDIVGAARKLSAVN